jgi:hypothetical protein
MPSRRAFLLSAGSRVAVASKPVGVIRFDSGQPRAGRERGRNPLSWRGSMQASKLTNRFRGEHSSRERFENVIRRNSPCCQPTDGSSTRRGFQAVRINTSWIRLAVFMLLVALSLQGSLLANAQTISVAENARQSARAAKKQQKMQNRSARRQRHALKKYQKAQRKANKKANRRLKFK